MTTTKRCRRGKREDKPRVLPVGWRRSEGGGVDTPTESNSSDEEEEVTLPPISTSRNPSLVHRHRWLTGGDYNRQAPAKMKSG
jgi:hypothetical protein